MCGGAECLDIIVRLLAIGLSSGALIALNAIGVTLVYDHVRQINFAHGDLFALSTALIAWGIESQKISADSPPLQILGVVGTVLALALGGGALANAAVERLAFRPFRGRSRVAPLIATIGISFMLYQCALFLRYLTNVTIPYEHRSQPGLPELPRLRIAELLPQNDLIALFNLPFRTRVPAADLLLPLCALAFALGVEALLRYSRIGRALRASSQDSEAAALCGVNTDRTPTLAFALGGALAAAAAMLFTLYYTHPLTSYGAQSGLTAFTAAVLGGIGQPLGALAGGMILGIVGAFSDYFLATQWTPVVLLALLLALLLLRPTGLGGDTTTTTNDGLLGPLRRARRGRVLAVCLLGAALVYPMVDQLFGWQQLVIVTILLIYATAALGLNLLLGYAGLLDLGYGASFALGAYLAGLMLSGIIAPWPGSIPDFTLVVLLCALASGTFGLLNALVTRRLRGEYLAIATIAFGQIIYQLSLNLSAWTGGSAGLAALPAPALFGWRADTTIERYYLVAVVLVLVLFGCLRLRHSRIGRAWAAQGMDESAAASMGIDVWRARTLAFVLGGTIAGVAGALMAGVLSYVDPTQSEFRISAMFLAMVTIGGAGSAIGTTLGALLVAGYDLIGIPQLGAWAAELARDPRYWMIGLLDLRGISYFSFGLALYLTIRVRARRVEE